MLFTVAGQAGAFVGPLLGTLLPALAPAAGFVVLLTFGQMLVTPAARAWVPDLAVAGRLGLYTPGCPPAGGPSPTGN